MQAVKNRKEIRCAIRSGREDKPGPILHSTGDNQKVHLVSRDSKGINFGTYVIAEPVRELDRCTIYHCEPLGDDRMVVRAVLANDMSETFVEYRGKQECYWGTHNRRLEDFAELVTPVNHSQHFPWSGQLQEWTLLITAGKEGDVLETLEQYFNNTLAIQFCPCGHVERMTEKQMTALGLDPKVGTFSSDDCPQCKADQNESDRELESLLSEWPELP